MAIANPHMWVEIQLVPVTVTFDENEAMSVYASDEAVQIAEGDRTYFCWLCSQPCNSETDKLECIGHMGD